jgi:hypothetical protein
MRVLPWVGRGADANEASFATRPRPAPALYCRAVKGCGACASNPLGPRCTKLTPEELRALSVPELTWLQGLPVCPLDADDELLRRRRFASSVPTTPRRRWRPWRKAHA